MAPSQMAMQVLRAETSEGWRDTVSSVRHRRARALDPRSDSAPPRHAAVSRTAAGLGVAWWTVMRQVIDRGVPLVDDPQRLAQVSAVGVDETAYLRANATRSTLFATGIADLTPGRTARLLDVVEGRSGTVLAAWLADRDPTWRAGIITASHHERLAAPPCVQLNPLGLLEAEGGTK